MTQCPFAYYRHKQGTDSKPSFGISISEGASVYHCFACGVKGRLSFLPHALGRYKHPKAKEVRDIINKYEPLFLLQDAMEDKPTKILQALDEKWLDNYIPFKRWKAIAEISIRKWNLLFDPKNRAIVFPIYDEFSRLVAIKKRYKNKGFVIEPANTAIKSYGIWYGIHLIDRTKPVYLVEGERDAILLAQLGYNAMASMGASVSNAQIETLKRLKLKSICFFDNDNAGREAQNKISNAIGCPKIIYPLGIDVKDPAEAVEKGVIDKIISIDK